MTRRTTTLKVRTALLLAGMPLTTQQLMVETGLARNTVMTALDSDEVIERQGTYPTKWAVKDVPIQLVKLEDIFVRKVTPQEGWANWMDKNRQKLSDMLHVDARMSKEVREDLADLIETAGQYLTSLSQDLRETKNDPDWFQQLGGNLEK